MIAIEKKSQVTILLILGAIMVIVVVTFVLINNYSIKKTLEMETIDSMEIVFDVQPIKNFVDACFHLVSKKSLNEIFDENSTEEQLETFVKNNIDSCLDFLVFEEQGYKISKKEAAIEVSINKNDAAFKMNYPMIAGKTSSKTKTEIKDFFVRHALNQESI